MTREDLIKSIEIMSVDLQKYKKGLNCNTTIPNAKTKKKKRQSGTWR